MFEIMGLAYLYLFGYRWLWKRHEPAPNSDELFGNGGILFIIGFLGFAATTMLVIVLMVYFGDAR